MKKPLGITLGDANGVGPEILARSFAAGELSGPVLVFGDAAAIALAAETLKLDVQVVALGSGDPLPEDPRIIPVIDPGMVTRADVQPGQLSGKTGSAAVTHVETATRYALDGKISAFATLPINKEASAREHPGFQGHTELIAGICGVADYSMMLASDSMIVTHVSTHVALSEAIRRVKHERIETVIRLTHEAVRKLRPEARIAVAGLNPHAGENGAFGREDIDEIRPAVEKSSAEGMNVIGPVSADTIFMKMRTGKVDAVVCMYHDQGHIPMKLGGLTDAVNITIGLPIIRTSVDHGTAFDIAYQGIADTSNLTLACKYAQRLAGES